MACRVRRLLKSFVILERLFFPLSEAMAATTLQKWEKWQLPISFLARLKNLLPKGGNRCIVIIGRFGRFGFPATELFFVNES